MNAISQGLEESKITANLLDSRYYLNRELSWLHFNDRVQHEALDPRTPLLERLKFAAIFSSNLDEFFMVRISGLMEQIEAGVYPQNTDLKRELRMILDIQLQDNRQAWDMFPDGQYVQRCPSEGEAEGGSQSLLMVRALAHP